MSFIAKFDGGFCITCQAEIKQGEAVKYDPGQNLMHEAGACPDGAPERLHDWRLRLDASDDRVALMALEEAQVAPIGRQGLCASCRLELPMTGICGYC